MEDSARKDVDPVKRAARPRNGCTGQATHDKGKVESMVSLMSIISNPTVFNLYSDDDVTACGYSSGHTLLDLY